MVVQTMWRSVYGSRNFSVTKCRDNRIISAARDLFKYEKPSDFDPSLYRIPPQRGDSQTFDYLIVGGGSAGSVLAWRLLREGYSKIGIIESGYAHPHPWSRIPAGLGYAMKSSYATTNYYTVAQPELMNRCLTWPRGKGIGGSSNINGMVFVRGHPEDYDAWEKAGAHGWSYKDCLPYFKRSENCPHGADSIRGKHGPIKVTRNIDGFCSELVDRFLESGKEAGYKLEGDLSSPDRNGFGYYDTTVYNGSRVSVSEAYIPWKFRLQYYDDIKVLTRKKADKILFSGDKAIGVQCGGKRYFAKKEVIVCSGALESPLLLMRSGIGDENELKAEGIPVLTHVPGVGKNLQDHLEFYIQAKTGLRSLFDLYKSNATSALAMFYWYTMKEGPLTSGYLEAGAFISSDKSITNPDIQLHFFPCNVLDHGSRLPDYNCFQIHAGTNRPKSTGTISLKQGKTVIDPKYMTEKSDLDDMIKCVERTVELFETPSLKEAASQVLSDVSNVESFVRKNVESAYHPSGTCKMGDFSKDPMAVVDSDMFVRGVRNLRVVDASCIPLMISGNLNATVVMMAEKAAEAIIKHEEKTDGTKNTVPDCFYYSH